jgi:transposase
VDEREQQRKVRHRLGVLRHADEVTGNVSATCRYYGISRPTFYKWLHRYEELGEAGLRDGSSRPLSSPNATRAEIVGKIIYLRRHYHFGPRKIAMYLARYHDIAISPSGVWRILKRLDMNRLPSSQRYKRHKTRWKRSQAATATRPARCRLRRNWSNAAPARGALAARGRPCLHQRCWPATMMTPTTTNYARSGCGPAPCSGPAAMRRGVDAGGPYRAPTVNRSPARAKAVNGGQTPERPWPGQHDLAATATVVATRPPSTTHRPVNVTGIPAAGGAATIRAVKVPPASSATSPPS